MKHRNLIFYISTIGIFSILIYLVLIFGEKNLEEGRSLIMSVSEGSVSAWNDFLQSLIDNLSHPVAILLLQIVTILLTVRLFGWICNSIGQPSVIGEILAGVVLGPSLLGVYFPEVFEYVFPADSLGNISFLSQVGLILFMFIVGMELDIKVLKTRASNAVLISHASIIFPFALGIILSYFIYEHFTHQHVSFISFALFMGIAMSITAFPVLARIVHEKGINKTPLGAVVITCAAIDDITAWCLLAAVIAIVKAGSVASSLFVILTAVGYVVFMFVVMRPFLRRIEELRSSNNLISSSLIGVFFLVLFLSAYATEVIGIHALFGAFLAGVIMPPNMKFRSLLVEKIEDVALVLLLPLFFVYTGLRTQIGLLNDPYLWWVCGAIILVAVVGKFVGSALAARFVKQSWRDSLIIGALMNTRGLMELVVLNIGYDLGVLTDEMFAMMVIMALATTFMTSPALSLIDRIFGKVTNDAPQETKKFRILVSFEHSVMGGKLMRIANSLVRTSQSHSEVTMLHLSTGNKLYQYYSEQEEKDLFEPIIKEGADLGQTFVQRYEIANEVGIKTSKIANNEEFDLLLIGYKDSIFEGNFLGQVLGMSSQLFWIPRRLLTFISKNKRLRASIDSKLDETSRTIISKTGIPVGLLIDKGLENINYVFVPILHEDDVYVGTFIEQLTKNSPARVILWDAVGLSETSLDFVKKIQHINPYLLQVWNKNIELGEDVLEKQDLMIISLNSWRNLQDMGVSWMKSIPSTLILNHK